MLVLSVVGARDIECWRCWPQFDGIWNSHPILSHSGVSMLSAKQPAAKLPSMPTFIHEA